MNSMLLSLIDEYECQSKKDSFNTKYYELLEISLFFFSFPLEYMDI